LALSEQAVYTVFAMGLAGGEPALTAVPSVDATPSPMLLPASGAETPVFILPLAVLGLGLALVGAGLMLRRSSVLQ
jgi:hypothetical protein